MKTKPKILKNDRPGSGRLFLVKANRKKNMVELAFKYPINWIGLSAAKAKKLRDLLDAALRRLEVK